MYNVDVFYSSNIPAPARPYRYAVPAPPWWEWLAGPPEEPVAGRVRSTFPRRRNLGEVQGGYEHMMDPSPACPGSSPPHRAALCTRGPGLCVETRSPPDPEF